MTTITIAHHHYDIDAILFDKDGTLLNFGDLWLSWLTSLLELIDGRTRQHLTELESQGN